MSKADTKAGYTVGYGKPPSEHRFKKGQSGNPKGRPKKKAAKEPERPSFGDGRVHSLFEEEAFRKLQLNENGTPIEMSAMQALVRSTILEGIKGNRLSRKYAIELVREFEQDAEKRKGEIYARYARKKAEGAAKIARCKEQGIEPPTLYPHPDDILLDEANLEVYVLGPHSADQAIHFRRSALMRDFVFVQATIMEKCGDDLETEFAGRSGHSGQVMALLIEQSLPPSFRRSESETLNFVWELGRMTKRQLVQRRKAILKEMYELPESVAEQLEAHRRATTAASIINDAMAKVARELAEKVKETAKAALPVPRGPTCRTFEAEPVRTRG